MAKARDAFRTISEVSETLNTPAHVLRFWESKFKQIKPVKRAGGRRYYRPDDLALLAAIKDLLHNQGNSIKDTQRHIRETGVKAIVADGHRILDIFDADQDTIEAPKMPPPVATASDDGQPDLFAGMEMPPPRVTSFEVVDAETQDDSEPVLETKSAQTLPPPPAARDDVGSRILHTLYAADPKVLQRNADKIAPLAKKLVALRDELSHPW